MRRGRPTVSDVGTHNGLVPQVISLFSGAGGLDLGMSRAGIVPSVAVEIDPVFSATLAHNMAAHTRVLQADVSKLQGKDLAAGEVDVMFGGPPCQSFSTGGGRAGLSDPRGNLIFEYVRLIDEVRPRVFVLENVASLINTAIRHRPIADRPGKNWNLAAYSHAPQNTGRRKRSEPAPLAWDEQSGSALKYLLEVVSETLGYNVSFGVLDAADFGAPQHRMRFVMLGSREGEAPALPTPTHGPSCTARFATVRDAIQDLVESPGPGAAYTPAVREVFDLVPEGGNWRSLPTQTARAALGERSYAAGGGKTGFFRRLAWDKPSPTVTGRPNRKGSAMCHPEASRPISAHESARLQGFPDDWTWVGSLSAKYTQVGNAVPVALAEAVGRTVADHLAGIAPTETRGAASLIDVATTELRSRARNNRPRAERAA